MLRIQVLMAEEGNHFAYKKGMIDVGKDRIFRDNMIDLLQLYDICLFQNFHCEVLSRLFIPTKPYTPK